MILDTTTIKLEAVLAAGVAANQPEATVAYVTYNNAGETTKPAAFRTALNSTTDVTLLSAPSTQGFVKEVQFLSVYNKDTASVTVTIKTDDGTERIIIKATLLTLEALFYEKGVGWYSTDAAGAVK